MRKGFRKEIRSASPAQICYLPDYYTIKDSETQFIFKLENQSALHIEQNVFSVLENKYGAIVQLLHQQQWLSSDDAISLIDFVIQMKLRNPYFVEKIINQQIEQWHQDTFRKTEQLEAKNGKYKHLSNEQKKEAIDKLRDRLRSNPDFTKEIQQRSLIARSNPDDPGTRKFRKALLSSGWQLFDATNYGPTFITTDNPGFAVDKNGTHHNLKFNEGAIFIFPISPRLCLVITDADKDTSNQTTGIKLIPKNRVDTKLVLYVNDSQIQIFNNLLIASDDRYLSHIHDINSVGNFTVKEKD